MNRCISFFSGFAGLTAGATLSTAFDEGLRCGAGGFFELSLLALLDSSSKLARRGEAPDVAEGVDLGVSRWENMRVSFSFMDVRSAGFCRLSVVGGVSAPLLVPLPFGAGDFFPPSCDLTEGGDVELDTEAVLEP